MLFRSLDTTVTTLNAGTATGNVTAILGAVTGAATMTGGGGNDVLTATAAAQNYTINGGAGDDTIDVSGNYTTNDTLGGGDGDADKLILAVTEADPATAQTNVTGFEILSIDTDASNDEVDCGVFGVNILGADQEAISTRFAVVHGAERFEGVAWTKGTTGAPLLDGAIARPSRIVGDRYNQLSAIFWNAVHDTLAGRGGAAENLARAARRIERLRRGGKW